MPYARTWAPSSRAESPAGADVVVPVPDSGVPAAIGFAQANPASPYRTRHRAQPLCRSHLHPANPVDPRDRRAASSTAPIAAWSSRQADRAPGRFDRARHDLDQDRADDARRGGQGGAFPHLVPADHLPRLLRHRHSRPRQAAGCAHGSRVACAPTSAPTRWLSCRSTASTAQWVSPNAIRVRPQFSDHCFTGDYPTRLTDVLAESSPKQWALLAEAS